MGGNGILLEQPWHRRHAQTHGREHVHLGRGIRGGGRQSAGSAQYRNCFRHLFESRVDVQGASLCLFRLLAVAATSSSSSSMGGGKQRLVLAQVAFERDFNPSFVKRSGIRVCLVDRVEVVQNQLQRRETVRTTTYTATDGYQTTQ